MGILDAIIDAGLSHELTWAQVSRLLQTLGENPWDLSSWITVDELLAGIEPEPTIKISEYITDTRWPDRLLEDLPIAVSLGVCTAEEAEPWLAYAHARAGEVQVYESLPTGNAKLAELRREFPR